MSESHNPYAPPKAELVDDTTAGPRPRPRAVNVALALIAINILMGLFGQVRYWQYFADGVMSGLAILWQLFRLVLAVMICVVIARGQNWARMLLLFFTVLGMFSAWLAVWASLPMNLPAGVRPNWDPPALFTLLLPTLLNVVANYLLFVPARGWFANRT